MPEGSSSDAPVIRPGPRARRKPDFGHFALLLSPAIVARAVRGWSLMFTNSWRARPRLPVPSAKYPKKNENAAYTEQRAQECDQCVPADLSLRNATVRVAMRLSSLALFE